MKEPNATIHAITPEFIRRIPKTDLHLHLDGSLRLPTLIELARQEKVALPSSDPTQLRATVFKDLYADLPDYLTGFRYTCAVMQTAENIERIAMELAEDNIAEGVRYVEVRFAPQLHLSDNLTVRDTLNAVHRGLNRAKRAFNARPEILEGRDVPFEYGIIVCALRSFNAHMGRYYRQILDVLAGLPRKEVFALASLELVRQSVQIRDEEGLPIVGFDLAGEEAGYPAAVHARAYQYAHDHFLKKTVHAGEAYGPESIFQAITGCHANRIGHGTFLFAFDLIQDRSIADPQRYVEQLAEYIASQRITIEACLTSNLQTVPTMHSATRHPLAHMIAHEMSVTLCTDNRLVSSTTVCRELELAVSHLGITPHQFRNVVIAGFKGSFFPASYASKRAYVRKVIDRYEAVEKAMLGRNSRCESIEL